MIGIPEPLNTLVAQGPNPLVCQNLARRLRAPSSASGTRWEVKLDLLLIEIRCDNVIDE